MGERREPNNLFSEKSAFGAVEVGICPYGTRGRQETVAPRENPRAQGSRGRHSENVTGRFESLSVTVAGSAISASPSGLSFRRQACEISL